MFSWKAKPNIENLLELCVNKKQYQESLCEGSFHRTLVIYPSSPLLVMIFHPDADRWQRAYCDPYPGHSCTTNAFAAGANSGLYSHPRLPPSLCPIHSHVPWVEGPRASPGFLFIFWRVFFYFLFFLICSECCHTLKWNVLEFKCLPHPGSPSHLPLHPLPPGLPIAPGPSACLLGRLWWFTSLN